MALLVTLLALAMPSLSRSLRQRNLEQEAARMLALTEYGRDEAASQGVPVVVWVDPDHGHFGAEVKKGFDTPTPCARKSLCSTARRLRFDPPEGGVASPVQGHGFNVAEFAPDGTLDPASVHHVTHHRHRASRRDQPHANQRRLRLPDQQGDRAVNERRRRLAGGASPSSRCWRRCCSWRSSCRRWSRR